MPPQFGFLRGAVGGGAAYQHAQGVSGVLKPGLQPAVVGGGEETAAQGTEAGQLLADRMRLRAQAAGRFGAVVGGAAGLLDRGPYGFLKAARKRCIAGHGRRQVQCTAVRGTGGLGEYCLRGWRVTGPRP